jgi:hypothetical protein
MRVFATFVPSPRRPHRAPPLACGDRALVQRAGMSPEDGHLTDRRPVRNHPDVLGEFFAARPEDIDEALVADGPYGRLPTVEAKGLSAVSLATLGEILGVGTYDDLVNRIAEGPQAESGGSWCPHNPGESP